MPNSKVKYQILPSDDRTPALEVNMSEIDINSSESTTASNQVDPNHQLNSIIAGACNLPQQNDANKTVGSTIINLNEEYPSLNELPTYNEAVYQKRLETLNTGTNSNAVNYDSRETQPVSETLRDEDIGTDCMFITAFIVSFFFNWIGFFTSICLIPTIAGKYGALSGFGLSMAKWVAILRYQEWLININDVQQKLFFWIFFLIGIYLFFRGLLSYVQIKYNQSLSSRRINIQWLTFR